MARPTNKARVLRLLNDFGDTINEKNQPLRVGLPLDRTRHALGPGADSAILDLIEEGHVKVRHGAETYLTIEG